MTATATKARTTKPALEPLDFSEYVEPPSDNPELDAFKKQVVEEARKHSRNHHCGEYKSVLRNLGISEKATSEVKVTFTTAVGFSFTVKVKPEELAGKTSDEQAKTLVKKLGDVKVSGAGGSGALKIAPDSIVEWSLPEKKAPTEQGTDDAPDGYEWRYISNDGRVRHLVIRERNGDFYNGSTVYTGCGKNLYRSWMPAADVTPTKATGGNCARCTRSGVNVVR